MHMAKSKFDITPEKVEEIKELAANGFQIHQFWEYYGISKSTWYAKIDAYDNEQKEFDPDYYGILDIIKKSKSKKHSKAQGYLWDYIEDGRHSAEPSIRKLGLTALMFYLKTQCGWSEKPKTELEPEQNREIDYTIPTSNPIDASRAYQKIMEVSK